MVTMDKVVILECFFDKKMSVDFIYKNNKIKVNIQILRTKYKEESRENKIYLSNTFLKLMIENE